ncbi:MAG: hypothetical protein ACLFWL_07030 [Candidatus Brocadiia bacterium]
MLKWSRLVRCAVILAVALLFAAPGPKDKKAEPKGKAAEKRQKKHRKKKKNKDKHRAVKKFIHRATSIAHPRHVSPGSWDPLQVYRRLFSLNETQKKQLMELQEQRNEERQEMIAQLNEKYAEKAEGILIPEQKERYKAVDGALQTYRENVAESRDKLLAKTKEPLSRLVKRGYVPHLRDLYRHANLGLTGEQKKKRDQYYEENRKAMKEALANLEKPSGRKDMEAWKNYHKKLREIKGQGRNDLTQKIESLLTPEQKKHLEEVKEAVSLYHEETQKYREQMREDLEELFQTDQTE